MTTNKLTVRLCRERTQEILELHKQIKNGYRGMSLEHVQGLIDDLREDVIQTIANGSKCPYALTRLIADLPRVHYGAMPVEPPPVAEVAANFVRSFNRLGTQLQEITKVVASSTYGKVKTPAMTSEQAYAIRKFLISDVGEPADKYPPGTSLRELREAFDALLVVHDQRKRATERIIEAANAFLEACEVDETTNSGRLPTADCRLPTADSRLPITDNR